MEVHPLSPLLDCAAHYYSSWDRRNLSLITKQSENFEVLATLKVTPTFILNPTFCKILVTTFTLPLQEILFLNSLFSLPAVFLDVGLKQSESKKWQEGNFIPELKGKATCFLDKKILVTVTRWSLASRNHVRMDCCTQHTNCMITAKPYSSKEHHLRCSECDYWLYYLSFNLPRSKTFHLCCFWSNCNVTWKWYT